MEVKDRSKIAEEQERRGRLRFKTGAEFLRSLELLSYQVAGDMRRTLASNYPDTILGQIGALFRSWSEELMLLQNGTNLINEDKYYQSTRAEYLWQMLASLLYLGNRSTNVRVDSEEYRQFLLKVKDSFFRGSSPEALAESLTDITGVPVSIREAYKLAQQPNSFFTLKDANKIWIDLGMDGVLPTNNLGMLIQDLFFFIELIRPARVLFDVNLVWNEDLNINNCANTVFGASQDGIAQRYDLSPMQENIYAISKMSFYVGDTSQSDLVQDDWQAGVVDWIDEETNTIFMQDGTICVKTLASYLYNWDADGDYRVDWSLLSPGAEVRFTGVKATGWFKFYSLPQRVALNTFLQFDPLYQATPEFQGSVVKLYGSNGRFPEFDKLCDNVIADQPATDLLVPMYEDLRIYCDWPEAKPIYAEFTTPAATPVFPEVGGTFDLPAYINPSSEPNVYQVSTTPMFNVGGELISADEVVLYVNGRKVLSGVEYVDAIAGAVFLNFMPPAGANLRIYYYWSEGILPKGINQDFQVSCDHTFCGPCGVPVVPIPVPPADTSMELGACLSIIPEGSYVARLLWPYVVPSSMRGDSYDWQMDQYPILNEEGLLAEIGDVSVYLDGVLVPDAVVSLRPLLGHVRISFIPPNGSTLRFSYFYQGRERQYGMVYDDLQYTTDTVYGRDSKYSQISDVVSEDAEFGTSRYPVKPYDRLLTIGYKYRAFNLSNTSVLNSSDTLLLSGYSKPVNKVSLASSYNRLSYQDQMYSPEFLLDINKYVHLDDAYLGREDPAPAIWLKKGIPLFVQTFTDTTAFKYLEPVVPTESTYHDDIPGAHDFGATLSICAKYEQTGLVEYAPLSRYAECRKLFLYSDLKLFKTQVGTDLPLTPICDTSNMSVDLVIDEEYYPNREIRLNDYKDYLLRELNPSVVVGDLKALNGSRLLKSVDVNWNLIRRGSMINIGEFKYTVIDVLNDKTIKINEPFGGDSGRYAYEVDTEIVRQIDVLFNNVVRKLKVNLNKLSGVPGENWVTVNFPDPDPDPYPRNPGNPFIAPTAPPLLTGQVHPEGGESNFFLTEEEADKMVKWRNWDQDMAFFIGVGTGSPLQEDLNSATNMDDLADGIKVLWWNPTTGEFVTHVYSGTLVETSEEAGTVFVSDYPNGMIRVFDTTDTDDLTLTSYRLKNTVIRQILPDNSITLVQVDEFVRP